MRESDQDGTALQKVHVELPSFGHGELVPDSLSRVVALEMSSGGSPL